jgi:hypothetical protein
MATLAIQNIDQDGLEATYAAATASGGDKVIPGAGSFVHVVNGSGADITVTLVTPGTVEGLSVDDQEVVVTAGESRFIAVSNLYRNPSDGLATITYSAATSVTVASLRAPVAG